MIDLANDVFAFDRKERNWLIRRASDGSLFESLNNCFGALGHDLKLSSNLPWHIDFHIDWLVALLEGGPLRTPRLNPTIDGREAIRGTNEDFDLVCIAGNDVIVVEAKGEGRWSRRRIEEKLRRLSYVAPSGQASLHPRSGRVFFALTSPKPPSTSCLSDHGVWGTLPWVPLDVPPRNKRRRVVRCANDGKKDKNGGFFLVR